MKSNLKLTNQCIEITDGVLSVPDQPFIPCIPGDGIGPEAWAAAQSVIDAAVAAAYGGALHIHWLPILAGEAAFMKTGSWLPEETLSALHRFKVGIKGPLTTPVGGGIRSLNVALRRELDLYACMRPVRYFQGVPSPIREPENVDMVIFRENTEDVYAGIEFDAESPETSELLDFFKQKFSEKYSKIRFPDSSALGLKPVSREGSSRLVRAAIKWALDHHRKSVTLVHKGNIMKYTEGGFRRWGYETAEQDFIGAVYTSLMWKSTVQVHGREFADQEKRSALESGKLWVDDIITDAMFQAALIRPQDFDVLVTTNLNGDYLSDALAAEVGGVGIAPGANINFETGAAVFEATHGTAPTLAGLNRANPSSLILSGEMLLRYIGWTEAADLVLRGIESAFSQASFTEDLSSLVPGCASLSTSQFAKVVVQGILK